MAGSTHRRPPFSLDSHGAKMDALCTVRLSQGHGCTPRARRWTAAFLRQSSQGTTEVVGNSASLLRPRRHIHAYSCTPMHPRYPTCRHSSTGAISAETWFIILRILALTFYPATRPEVRPSRPGSRHLFAHCLYTRRHQLSGEELDRGQRQPDARPVLWLPGQSREPAPSMRFALAVDLGSSEQTGTHCMQVQVHWQCALHDHASSWPKHHPATDRLADLDSPNGLSIRKDQSANG